MGGGRGLTPSEEADALPEWRQELPLCGLPRPRPPHTPGTALVAAGLQPEVQGLRLPTGSPGAWSWRPGEPHPHAERGAWGAPKGCSTGAPPEEPSAPRGADGAAARPQGSPSAQRPHLACLLRPWEPDGPFQLQQPGSFRRPRPTGPSFRARKPASLSELLRGKRGACSRPGSGRAHAALDRGGRLGGGSPKRPRRGNRLERMPSRPRERGACGLLPAPSPAAPAPRSVRRELVWPPGLSSKTTKQTNKHPIPLPESGRLLGAPPTGSRGVAGETFPPRGRPTRWGRCLAAAAGPRSGRGGTSASR